MRNMTTENIPNVLSILLVILLICFSCVACNRMMVSGVSRRVCRDYHVLHAGVP